MKFLIPKLKGNDYASLITAFAVIVAVEYTSGAYDIWDGFIGLLAMGLGYSFIKDAKEYNDFWYSFITASLISLGAVSIISLLVFIVSSFPEQLKPEENIGFYSFIFSRAIKT